MALITTPIGIPLLHPSTSTAAFGWRRRAIAAHHQSDELSPSTLSVQTSSNTLRRTRRELVLLSVGIISGGAASSSLLNDGGGVAEAAEFADMPAIRGKDYGKSKMSYPDYTQTQSGFQYKDLRVGDGPQPKKGDTVVIDWDGYTIGYYGRIFEARNKTKGGSFEGNDKEFFKFKLGSGEVIPAFEEAVSGMALGGVRSHAG
ncbi:peptidyl-prolyl cis-trans isomerase FKBP19, chloroplastic isoform X2 [Mercurialis annua]|uniref:peptidyl-prolyl cis-trans isomerase FKBP19, chloroplastic isoform X2 n=1 Tax=Mercurialis annua TaxID=3986 RepID=UPI00215F3E72|nr:peptidyl-prolyl cis-trans isomerase FKBP19, chloroplastic isoform X2 [Mercurialis annua]